MENTRVMFMPSVITGKNHLISYNVLSSLYSSENITFPNKFQLDYIKNEDFALSQPLKRIKRQVTEWGENICKPHV